MASQVNKDMESGPPQGAVKLEPEALITMQCSLNHTFASKIQLSMFFT